jgi:hypothetical protein
MKINSTERIHRLYTLQAGNRFSCYWVRSKLIWYEAYTRNMNGNWASWLKCRRAPCNSCTSTGAPGSYDIVQMKRYPDQWNYTPTLRLTFSVSFRQIWNWRSFAVVLRLATLSYVSSLTDWYTFKWTHWHDSLLCLLLPSLPFSLFRFSFSVCFPLFFSVYIHACILSFLFFLYPCPFLHFLYYLPVFVIPLFLFIFLSSSSSAWIRHFNGLFRLQYFL